MNYYVSRVLEYNDTNSNKICAHTYIYIMVICRADALPNEPRCQLAEPEF